MTELKIRHVGFGPNGTPAYAVEDEQRNPRKNERGSVLMTHLEATELVARLTQYKVGDRIEYSDLSPWKKGTIVATSVSNAHRQLFAAEMGVTVDEVGKDYLVLFDDDLRVMPLNAGDGNGIRPIQD